MGTGPVSGDSTDFNVPAVLGVNTIGVGVKGQSNEHDGVQGFSTNFDRSGVVGTNPLGVGVLGQSDANDGVRGFSKHQDRSGVIGVNTLGVGVKGVSENHDGVQGFSKHQDRAGVIGTMEGGGVGVRGQTFGAGAGVHATSSDGTGLVASGGGLAALLDGDVHVTGKLSVKVDIELLNGDCAEEFRVAEPQASEPGTVMVLGDDETVRRSDEAYDRRVAGVVSGAGDYKPAIVLDARRGDDRRPLAVMGKVFCKVDAAYGEVEVGDLLTTSPSPGHAMKAADASRAFGSVIGKALRPLREGQALIPILVALQ